MRITKLTFPLVCWSAMALLFGSPAPAGAQQPTLTNAYAGSDGLFHLQVKTVVGQSYTIQTTDTLPYWTNVGSILNADTNLVSLVDPRPVSCGPRMFYRVMLGVQLAFNFSFLEFAQGGQFQGGFTPAVSYPVTLNSYSALLNVENDVSYPNATNVYFTGPAGSGLTNTPADPNNSNTNPDSASYQSPLVFNPAAAPGGSWRVMYRGTNQAFSVPDPQATARLVVPLPTVSVSGDVLQSLNWVYKNAANGTTLGGAPAYITRLQVQIEGLVGGRIYDSAEILPGTTSHTLSSTVNWSNVSGINMAYDDSLGNHYVVFFPKL